MSFGPSNDPFEANEPIFKQSHANQASFRSFKSSSRWLNETVKQNITCQDYLEGSQIDEGTQRYVEPFNQTSILKSSEIATARPKSEGPVETEDKWDKIRLKSELKLEIPNHNQSWQSESYLNQENKELRCQVEHYFNQIKLYEKELKLKNEKIDDLKVELNSYRAHRHTEQEVKMMIAQIDQLNQKFQEEHSKRLHIEKRVKMFIEWLKNDQMIYIENLQEKLGINYSKPDKQNKRHRRVTSVVDIDKSFNETKNSWISQSNMLNNTTNERMSSFRMTGDNQRFPKGAFSPDARCSHHNLRLTTNNNKTTFNSPHLNNNEISEFMQLRKELKR